MHLISQLRATPRLGPLVSCHSVAAVSASSTLQLQRRTMASQKALTLDNINPNVIKLEYAVRGPLVIRSQEIKKELEKGAKKPFQQVIGANVGDAHAMGQTPITFVRQLLAAVACPQLLEEGALPADVCARARRFLGACGGHSVGAYTQSQGIDLVRAAIADYIEKRDGLPSDPSDVFTTTGASTAIKNVLFLFSGAGPAGVMMPIPQYPLYSATIAEYGLRSVPYFLDEERCWGLTEQELDKSLREGRREGAVRALVLINPGNPTGQVLRREDLEMVVRFAHKHRLVVLADEVYQHNVYAEGSHFHSFKKVLREMGEPYASETQCVSFMSISKGFLGECGIRGGWGELCNIGDDVKKQLYKMQSATLCSPSLAQAAIYALVAPPQPGEPSHARFVQERDAVLGSLKERAQMIVQAFNGMEGFSCNPVQGAMYAFPRIDLPPKAIAAAEKANQAPDVFYAFQLLEATGICVVAGSGFGQVPGTYHFRTTILPQMEPLKDMLAKFQAFHADFTKKYQ